MDADEPLWNAFFTVLAADGKVIGGGVYVHFGERSRPALLTCAHVVNLALGRDEFATDNPGSAEVTLEFPAVPGARVNARVRRWWSAYALTDPDTPPERGRDGRWAADVAEIEPVAFLPAVLQPVPLATPALGDQVWAWRGNGDPRTAVRLRVNAPAGEWLVLEAPPTGFAVQPGYSGGPLWDRRRAAVVGLMVSAHERVTYSHMTTAVPIRQSYGIRGDVLRDRLLGNEDPRGRLDPRIWSLLKAQQQAAVSFPYRSVELHRDDLTQVYVRQQLAADSTAQNRTHTAEEAARAEAGGERPPRTIEEFLARFRHVLVVGDAGTGKSTLTLQLSAELVRVPGLRGNEPTLLVPVRVSARELAARPEGELRAAVSAVAQAEVSARLHIDIGDELCVRPPAGLAWLFIIDGLDEVQDANARAELSERLRRFMHVETGYRLLMTTREPSSREYSRWTRRHDLGRCEIEPFERAQRRNFVHKWFRDRPELADAFLAQISRARLEDVVSIPLLATVAAIVFEEQAGKPLPQTGFALYQRFVSHLYESRVEHLLADLRVRLAGWAEADRIIDRLVTGRIDLLEHCAAAWLRGAQPLQAALDRLRAAGTQPYPQPTNWAGVVSAVLTSTGLVIHDGTDLTFVHRSFAEHLAAAGEARRLPSQFDADDPTWWRALRGALADNNPRDREAVLHRALLADSTSLLDWLLAGDDQARELGARLIFEGVPSTHAHHESLAETLGHWVSRIARSSKWAAQLVRVIDAMRIAPAPVADVLVELLDARFPLGVRDAAIRALLRSGTAHGEAVQALAAIMDEHPLTGAQRVRAAEMLMDLGTEARALARAGLLNITYEHNWVMSGDRSQAAKLVEEIDAATPFRDELTADVLRHGVKTDSDAWERSTLLPYTGQNPTNDHQTFQFKDESSLNEFGTDGEPLRSRTPGLYEKPRFRHGRPPLLPGLRAALGLPVDDKADPGENEENDPAATLSVVFAAVRAGISDPAPSGTNRGIFGHSAARQREDGLVAHGPHGPDLSEERWDSIARWLCARPEAHAPSVFGARFRLWAVKPITSGRLHALAAALIHGEPGAARGAYELLAPSILNQARAEFPLQLLRIAASSARSPIRPETAEPVIAAICGNLGLGETPYFSLHVRTARAMGSNLFAAYLTSRETGDPRRTVRALLALGPEHTQDAVRFLAVQARALPRSVPFWCEAARMLRQFRDASPAVIRLLREVTDAAHEAEDLLELCRTLIEFGATDAAAIHLVELAQDTSADSTHRCEAVRLLSDSEGAEERADLAHAVLAELTASASSVEQLALAQTLQRVDPRGRYSAAALVFAVLEDVNLPVDSRQQALALLAGMGPDIRRRMAAGLEQLYVSPADSDSVRLTSLRNVSLWGPDLHRAVQGIWERTTHHRTGITRVAMAAELHKLGWLSESRSSRLLIRIARSEDEEAHVRVAAAHALLRHGPGQCHASGEVLHGLVRARQVPSLLAVQTARDLASAGGLLEARRVLNALIRNAEVPDSHRYKAATILLMVDLACGPETLAVLRYMINDMSLSEHTRAWAAYAVDCAEIGLRMLDGSPPDSWLHS